MSNDLRTTLFKDWPGCTNHDCVVRGPTPGMHTNGNCKCLVNASRGQLLWLQQRLRVFLNTKEE